MQINAKDLDHRQINDRIRDVKESVLIDGCLGQRFIAAGMSEKDIAIKGTPGNALGAYLNGAVITVMGNAQDAVGDTMNEGSIIVHGNIGDAAGYAMRGGSIFVKGDAGYRAGIHMKEYEDKIPVIVIGGRAGSFLGEYQAGGIIIVLNLWEREKKIIGSFPCTGMHGGKMFLRSDPEDIVFPEQVTARPALKEDLLMIRSHVLKFSELFDTDAEEIMKGAFTVITPDSSNPYKQMYVQN